MSKVACACLFLVASGANVSTKDAVQQSPRAAQKICDSTRSATDAFLRPEMAIGCCLLQLIRRWRAISRASWWAACRRPSSGRLRPSGRRRQRTGSRGLRSGNRRHQLRLLRPKSKTQVLLCFPKVCSSFVERAVRWGNMITGLKELGTSQSSKRVLHMDETCISIFCNAPLLHFT